MGMQRRWKQLWLRKDPSQSPLLLSLGCCMVAVSSKVALAHPEQIWTMAFRLSVTHQLIGLFETVGVQHGGRRAIFTFRARTTTQQRSIRHLRMEWRANRIRKRRPSKGNVECSQIPRIQLD